MLNKNSITFGKYKGSTLDRVLRDRNYCNWLLTQDWFLEKYEYLYNRIREYEPRSYFVTLEYDESKDFLDRYTYFNLVKPENLKIELLTVDLECYKYYISVIETIKDKIYTRLENDEDNPYDIKAPTSWLKKFEEEYGIPRTDFKEFIDAYDLPNIPYIIERIKKEGGITYNGANSYLIAKNKSENQEKWWEEILRSKYGEDIGVQFKYENCIFDFINISTKTIFECKLGLKDFNEAQHTKYKIALKEFRIIYLISRDCVIDMEKKSLYTINKKKYKKYISQIPENKKQSYLDVLITNFDIIKIENIESLFGACNK